MKKQLVFLFVLAALPLTLCAEKVTREQALEKATKFMSGKTFETANSSRLAKRRVSGENVPPFYVFNATEGGYVIVSGDDRTREILGYSSTGTLDLDNLPDNLQWWLDEYARQIESLGTTTVVAKTSQKASTRSAISPLIHTQWDQYEPYNYMCPNANGRDYDESGYDASHRCPTGCVATAMAQVMNYWQWPESCPELPAYTISKNNYTIKALPSTTFKWELMKNSYSDGETGDAANAVAELMRYCGQAVHMNYTTYESSASVWRKVMVKTFNYSHAIREISRDSYDLDTWENIIYKELTKGCPVLYLGQAENGGHEFIVDGYASNGLFHINWGWGGYQDNYFVLSAADPYKPGTAGASSSKGYKSKQIAMIGIKPFREGEVEPYAVLSDDGLTVTFYYDSHMLSRKGVDIGPRATATTAVFDDSFADYEPNSTSEWFKGCSNLKEIKGISNLNTEYVTNMSSMFEGCSNLTSLDLSDFKTNHVTSMYGMFYGCSSLTTIYAGDGWNTEKVTSSNYMFSSCTKLVGGLGTEYNWSHTDHAYARIDGGAEAPGYFCVPGQIPPRPYAVLSEEGKTVTFYFDTQKGNRGGIDINTLYEFPSPYGSATIALIDASFADYRPTSTFSWFLGCSSLITITGIENIMTDNVTNMSSMFEGCSNLTSLDLSGYKTNNVTDMWRMFYGCSSLTTIYAGDGWNTEKVTSSNHMFSSCTKLVGGLGTEYDWSHTDHAYARIDNGTDVPGYFTYKAPSPYAMLSDDGLTVTFYYDYYMLRQKGVDIGFDIALGKTPYDAATTVIFDDSFADYKPNSTSAWFKDCSKLKEIKSVSNLNTEYVTNMSNMFEDCSSLTSLDLGGFKTYNVMDLSCMFLGCTSLTTVYAGDGWSTEKVTSGYRMFDNCIKLIGGEGTEYNSSHTDHTYARIDDGTDSPGYFTSNKEPYAVLSDDGLTVTFYYDSDKLRRNGVNIGYDNGKWKTPYATATTAVFDDSFTGFKPYSTSAWFKGCSNLKEIKGLSNLNTDNVTNMSSMFSGCSSLTSLDLGGFKTDNVTDMSSMFDGCSSLMSLDLSGFKTVDVTYMKYMFSGCSSLTSLDVSSFKTNNVKDIKYMFYGCSNLTTIYAGDGWNVKRVTSDNNMFAYCTKLVGGQGTKYNSSYTDNTYARIDGGTEAPGYLTYKVSSGIKGITVGGTIDGNVPVYDIGGSLLPALQKGINIIRLSNGQIKKVFIQ